MTDRHTGSTGRNTPGARAEEHRTRREATRVRLERVTRRFGATPAVADLDLTVLAGELVGLVGPDGAGKTTTARLAAGVLAPTQGRVTLAGDRVGYLSGRFSLYPDLTVWENVTFFGRVQGLRGRQLTREAERLLDWVGLQPHARRLAGQLSGGMRQKLALACALVHTPPVLVLDEPTTAVDPLARRDFWGLLREAVAQGTGALVTTPYMDEAEACDRVGFLHRGRLLAVDRPAALKERVPLQMALVRPIPESSWSRRDLREAAAALPGVRWTQPVGGGVRVALEAHLPTPPEGLQLIPTAPSLEDAYIWLAEEVPA